jgi:hypothetical protein
MSASKVSDKKKVLPRRKRVNRPASFSQGRISPGKVPSATVAAIADRARISFAKDDISNGEQFNGPLDELLECLSTLIDGTYSHPRGCHDPAKVEALATMLQKLCPTDKKDQ